MYFTFLLPKRIVLRQGKKLTYEEVRVERYNGIIKTNFHNFIPTIPIKDAERISEKRPVQNLTKYIEEMTEKRFLKFFNIEEE